MSASSSAAPDTRIARVVVVGSINHDRFVQVARFPRPGETISATSTSDGLGGKGANQAVAASLAGADVAFVGAVGTDPSGRLAIETLTSFGIDCRGLRIADSATGLALITVDDTGENTIVVHPGANSTVGSDALSTLDATAPAVILTQGELPVEAVVAAAHYATVHGARFVLNLAPVIEVPDGVLAQADPLILNEHEAAILLGRAPASSISDGLDVVEGLSHLARAVVMTMGSAGVVVKDATGQSVHLPAVMPPGPVVDTTGAGDAFVGVLAARIANGESLLSSARIANRAASISVSRTGTLASYPSAAEMAAHEAPSQNQA